MPDAPKESNKSSGSALHRLWDAELTDAQVFGVVVVAVGSYLTVVNLIGYFLSDEPFTAAWDGIPPTAAFLILGPGVLTAVLAAVVGAKRTGLGLALAALSVACLVEFGGELVLADYTYDHYLKDPASVIVSNGGPRNAEEQEVIDRAVWHEREKTTGFYIATFFLDAIPVLQEFAIVGILAFVFRTLLIGKRRGPP